MLKHLKKLTPLLLAISLLTACAQTPQEDVSTETPSSSPSGTQAQGEIIPYGQLLDVDGKKMNVLVTGEGEKNIVWLPGFTDVAPGLSYTKMLEELSPNYKVAVVEPFGYGLSDFTDKPRTIENITSEIHEAVQQLGMKEYILVAHSISGVYAMQYINDYPNEVTAFIGLDTSTPDMMDEYTMETIMDDSTDVSIPEVSEEINAQYRLIAARVAANDNFKDEDAHMKENFDKAKAYSFPTDLPVAFFLSKDSIEEWSWRPFENNDWVKMHQNLIDHSKYAEIYEVDADHLVYQLKYKEIVEQMNQFLADAPN